MDNTILKISQRDYAELEHYVKNYRGTFEKLLKSLNGFNYTKNDDYEFFDVNYKKYINTTVYNLIDDDFFYISDSVTVWDYDDGISEDFYICQDCGVLIPENELIEPNPTIGCLCKECLHRFNLGRARL